ncbi:MAG: hypothetical protein ACI4J1_06660 [Ruminiclostridium sp.]
MEETELIEPQIADEEKEKLLEQIAFLNTENAALKAEIENLGSQLEAARTLPDFSTKTKQPDDKFKAIKEIFRNK